MKEEWDMNETWNFKLRERDMTSYLFTDFEGARICELHSDTSSLCKIYHRYRFP